LIALIPILFTKNQGLIFLIIALSFHAAIAAVGNSSWNPWMRDLIPESRLGTFFSKRMRYGIAISLPLSLLAGFFIDYYKEIFSYDELYSYSILFFLGFLAGMIGVYFIYLIPEPRMTMVNSRIKLTKLFQKPFKDVNYKNLLMFLGPWNFAVNLVAPFFTVYMLNRLELDISLIISLGVFSQITSLVFLNIWGKLSDRYSNKSVLVVSGSLFMLCILAWSFTAMPEKYILTIPILIVIHFLMGLAISGVTLSSGNIAATFLPNRISEHLSVFSSISDSFWWTNWFFNECRIRF